MKDRLTWSVWQSRKYLCSVALIRTSPNGSTTNAMDSTHLRMRGNLSIMEMWSPESMWWEQCRINVGSHLFVTAYNGHRLLKEMVGVPLVLKSMPRLLDCAWIVLTPVVWGFFPLMSTCQDGNVNTSCPVLLLYAGRQTLGENPLTLGEDTSFTSFIQSDEKYFSQWTGLGKGPHALQRFWGYQSEVELISKWFACLEGEY